VIDDAISRINTLHTKKIYFFSVSCQMNNVYGKPGPNSIWTTTALGDIYVFDPAIAEVKQRNVSTT